MMRLLIWFCFCLLMFACTQPVNPPVKNAETVEVNIDNYLNRISISLLGRKPVEAELKQCQAIIKKQGTGIAARQKLIEYFMSLDDFVRNFENMYRQEILEGTSPNVIKQYQVDIDQIVTLQNDPNFLDLMKYYYQSLETLRYIKDNPEAYNGMVDMQRIMVDNYVYDQINMGHDNYVISIFQHLLMRKPTHYELVECKKMMSFSTGILFLKTGNSKADLLDIIFTSNNYYEAQVRYWYIKLLNREPNTSEINQLVFNLTSGSFEMKDLLLSILASNQYAGLN